MRAAGSRLRGELRRLIVIEFVTLDGVIEAPGFDEHRESRNAHPDTPTRALRCAFGLADAVGGLGIQIRSGIHAGEIELRDDDVGGIAVQIASRALSFAPLGAVSLRGIPGQWELFEASTKR